MRKLLLVTKIFSRANDPSPTSSVNVETHDMEVDCPPSIESILICDSSSPDTNITPRIRGGLTSYLIRGGLKLSQGLKWLHVSDYKPILPNIYNRDISWFNDDYKDTVSQQQSTHDAHLLNI